jgi:prostaglandin-E synthase
LHIIKGEEDQEEFWPRLLKDKALEKNQIKIDWDRYVDEDEEEEGFDTSALEGGQGMGGMPPGGGMPGGMGGGMPGMGGEGGGMPPGMDMEALMKQMGGMGGGAPGGGGGGMPGGMDMEAMMKQMGGMGGMGGGPPGEGDDEGDDDEGELDADDLPDLEEVN